MDNSSSKSTLGSDVFLIEERSPDKNGQMGRLRWLKRIFFIVLGSVLILLSFGIVYQIVYGGREVKIVEEVPAHFDVPTAHFLPTTPRAIQEIIPLDDHLRKNVFPQSDVVAERLEIIEPAKPIIVIYDLSREHNVNSPGLAPFAHCPSLCFLSTDMSYFENANVVLFSHGDEDRLPLFKGTTAFVYMHSESPANLKASSVPDYASYIASYRLGADFYAPYGIFTPFNETKPIKEDIYKGKTGADVVYIASNCYTQNNRAGYVAQLFRYIKVDIYGKCNGRLIPKSAAKTILQKAFFYLAFENSNCQEYITEKFWVNALENNVIPVVMGAKKEDYLKVAPPNSFIHVDDFKSPQELARYLHTVKNNQTLYNSFFKWHEKGIVGPSNVLCDVCDYFTKNSELRTTSALTSWLEPKGQCEAAKGPLAAPIGKSLIKG